MCRTCAEYTEYSCTACGQGDWNYWDLPDADEQGLIDCPFCGKHAVKQNAYNCPHTPPKGESKKQSLERRLKEIAEQGKQHVKVHGEAHPLTEWYRGNYRTVRDELKALG
jgi:DNA-directed RNA polymerase subunit RPC12/RpoP